MKKTNRLARLVGRGAPVIAALASLPVHAQSTGANDGFTPRFSLGVLRSDNPYRLPEGSAAETVTDTLAGLHFQRQTARFEANADASVNYRAHLENSENNETLPRIGAGARYAIVPERFIWKIEDNLGQISTRPFDALSPVDRENANFFSTGPEFIQPLGARNRLLAEVTYGRVNYEVSPTDNERINATAAFERSLSRTSSLSLDYEHEEVKFSNSPLLRRYENNGSFVKYALEAARTSVSIEAGGETLTVAGSSETGARYALALERVLNPLTVLTAEYRHGFSDAANTFRANAADTFTEGDQNTTAQAAPFVSDRAYVTLTRQHAQFSFALQAFSDRERYKLTNQFDRTDTGASTVVEWRRTSLSSLFARLDYNKEKREFQGINVNDLGLTVGYSRRLGRSLQLEAQYARYHRTGDQDQFNENRYGVALTWSPVGAREKIFDSGGTTFRLQRDAERVPLDQLQPAPANPN